MGTGASTALPDRADANAVRGVLGSDFDEDRFNAAEVDGTVSRQLVQAAMREGWDGGIDTKQADSDPAMLEQVINAMRGRFKKAHLRYHYTSREAIRYIANTGLRVGKQGKGGNGIFFFDTGPHEYDPPYYGMKKDPHKFDAFAKRLTADGRGEAYSEDAPADHKWMEVEPHTSPSSDRAGDARACLTYLFVAHRSIDRCAWCFWSLELTKGTCRMSRVGLTRSTFRWQS